MVNKSKIKCFFSVKQKMRTLTELNINFHVLFWKIDCNCNFTHTEIVVFFITCHNNVGANFKNLSCNFYNKKY